MGRVLGVGEGLFVLAFIWTLCIFLCMVFSRAQTKLSNLGPLMIVVAAFFTVVLIFIPREAQIPTEEEEIKIYAYSIIYRSGLIAVFALFIILGLVMYLSQHAMLPVTAKRLPNSHNIIG